jgi:hypothetical protein
MVTVGGQPPPHACGSPPGGAPPFASSSTPPCGRPGGGPLGGRPCAPGGAPPCGLLPGGVPPLALGGAPPYGHPGGGSSGARPCGSGPSCASKICVHPFEIESPAPPKSAPPREYSIETPNFGALPDSIEYSSGTSAELGHSWNYAVFIIE